MRLAALFLLLLAACSRDVPPSAPPRAATKTIAAAERPQFELVNPAVLAGEHRIGRNVFAYPAAPSAPSVRAQATATAAVEVRPPEEKRDERKVEARFEFPYRYIGRFGTEGAQLAAFVADGEVTLARAGDVIAGKYLVRAIGIESAEVALVGSPDLSKILDIGQ